MKRWSRLRVVALAASLLVPLVGLQAGPASATTATAGSAAFQGNAFLPKFPCPPPPPFGTGPCVGSFSGQWAGHLTGVSGTSPFDVTWSTLGASTAHVSVPSFNYSEWQCAAGTETLLGIAQGSGTATVDPGQLQGKYQVVGEAFARDIVGVNFTFTFAWTRLGNVAVLFLGTANMQLNVSGVGWVTVLTGLTQVGVSDFAPTSETGSGVPSCSNPLTNVNGAIAGVLPFAGAF